MIHRSVSTLQAISIDVQIADMNGDNYPDFITIHGYSGQGLVSLTLFNGSL